MAIKLTDIVTVMKDKWTYGDKFFGYTEEFNDNHKTFYPSLLITPPDSVFPEVGLDNGWENYTFEVYFSDLYNRTAQANESIELRWQNLQDLATEWLDLFLKHYQAEAPITGFLEDESVVLERNKEVANDKLLQIKMTFTWRVLSKCFRPQSHLPNQIDNSLGLWLSADSGTTFKIATKQVSEWKDRSDRKNDFSQTVADNQPFRYTYQSGSSSNQDNFGVFNGKTRLNFPQGKKDYLEYSDHTDTSPPLSYTTNSFTIFIAAAYSIDVSDPNLEAALSVKNTVANMGSMELGKQDLLYYDGIISDGTNTINLSQNNFTEQSVAVWQIEGDTGRLWVNGVLVQTQTVAGFDITGKFIISDWYVGWNSVTNHSFSGDIAEIIVYDSALVDYKRKQVENYLNNKYKIY
tara:strand:+ start:2223 stop:3440 length:1218 start_codon:yes stop_codon:yes gene_type:complete